ncbi:MAG: hypothetical protein ACLFPQ_02150 [Candidatus Woesearchaeota archaeon]
MVSDQLINYIKEQKKKGYTDSQLAPFLKKYGYKDEDIKEGLKEASGKSGEPLQNNLASPQTSQQIQAEQQSQPNKTPQGIQPESQNSNETASEMKTPDLNIPDKLGQNKQPAQQQVQKAQQSPVQQNFQNTKPQKKSGGAIAVAVAFILISLIGIGFGSLFFFATPETITFLPTGIISMLSSDLLMYQIILISVGVLFLILGIVLLISKKKQ